MYLNKKEERLLSGEYGETAAKAMEILTAVGKIFEAERMVPVTSAQISGVSYETIGDAGIDFLEEFAKDGKVRVPSYLNPCAMDLVRWREMGFSKELFEKQAMIVEAYKKMGVELSLTCTPYLIGIVPKKDEHIAWSESSAVIFANSVLGARTNRESGISALASAIAGRTPCFGYHLDGNRTASLLIEVKAKLGDVSDFGALGYYAGAISKGRVPALLGIEKANSIELKSLGAAMAASGGVALFLIKGITPEWKLIEAPEKVEFTEKELKETKEGLSSTRESELVAIGCPHCSLKEIGDIAEKVRGRKVGKKLWVFTSRKIRNEAEKRGYVNVIENAGGKVLCDTCMVVSPIESIGIKKTATNSAKAAKYLASMRKQKVVFGSMDDFI
jgi:hypothetical protein